MFDDPAPVAMPDDRIKSPPFLSVAPLVAPLDSTVSELPAVFAVGFRSIQKVCDAEPLSDRMLVGVVVPMPTEPTKELLWLSGDTNSDPPALPRVMPAYPSPVDCRIVWP